MVKKESDRAERRARANDENDMPQVYAARRARTHTPRDTALLIPLHAIMTGIGTTHGARTQRALHKGTRNNPDRARGTPPCPSARPTAHATRQPHVLTTHSGVGCRDACGKGMITPWREQRWGLPALNYRTSLDDRRACPHPMAQPADPARRGPLSAMCDPPGLPPPAGRTR